MSTTNSVILQLQNDLQEANSTTGASDTTIHDAILTLISGYGGKSTEIKHSGTFTYGSNSSTITHNCNSSRYLMIIKPIGQIPESTDATWRAINIIGLYDTNGITFGTQDFNTVSAIARYNDGSYASVASYGNNSTENSFDYVSNSVLTNVEYSWELYDLSTDISNVM